MTHHSSRHLRAFINNTHAYACNDMVTRIFFPEAGESASPAKAVCQRCPVRLGCLEYAVDGAIAHGIWGGLTPKERRVVRRQQAGDRRPPHLETITAVLTGQPRATTTDIAVALGFPQAKTNELLRRYAGRGYVVRVGQVPRPGGGSPIGVWALPATSEGAAA